MIILDLEHEIASSFRAAGVGQPHFEARQLLLGLLNVAAADLFKAEDREAAPELVAKAQAWTAERLKGVPLAYLTGRKGFYKNYFSVTSGVLVPRPETEHVVEEAVARIYAEKLKVENFADLGCGSGCLGLSLLGEIQSAKLWAVDSSASACECTRRNAKALGLDGRVQVIDQAVESWQPTQALSLVVANPPYIATGDPNVQSSVHMFEPHQALYSGSDGLDAIRSWTAWTRKNLIPGGVFVCEFGAGQTEAVQEIISKFAFERIRVVKDLSGHDRVISAIQAR